MDASYKFFQNRACQYFPCHRGADSETFNCLFCYCPLYFLEECGGDATWRGGVKDCTNCLRPHAPDGYETTLTRLREEFFRRRNENKGPE